MTKLADLGVMRVDVNDEDSDDRRRVMICLFRSWLDSLLMAGFPLRDQQKGGENYLLNSCNTQACLRHDLEKGLWAVHIRCNSCASLDKLIIAICNDSDSQWSGNTFQFKCWADNSVRQLILVQIYLKRGTIRQRDIGKYGKLEGAGKGRICWADNSAQPHILKSGSPTHSDFQVSWRIWLASHRVFRKWPFF